MAKKTDPRPVDNGQAANEQEELHTQCRAERRELEAELAAIDGQIRSAITVGDIEGLEKLTARKAELPGLFMAASLAETNARHEVFNAADEANLKLLAAAEAERDKLQAALDKLRRDFEAKSAELTEQLQAANRRVGAAYSDLDGSRASGASCDAGFRRSLAALAGV